MKGAGWSLDFAIGLLIFIVSMVIGFTIIVNYNKEDTFNDVRITGNAISEDLTGEGWPRDWTSESAVKIGLTNGNRLDIAKFTAFANITYKDAQQLMKTPYDFYILFRNESGVMSIGGICGYGSPVITTGPDCEPTLPEMKDLILIKRIIIIGNSLSEMDIYSWH
jgi:hypothetical protein